MQLNVKNETSTLKAVVLGQPGSIGKVPTLEETYDAKSYESVLHNIYPHEEDIFKEMRCFESVLLKYGDGPVFLSLPAPACNPGNEYRTAVRPPAVGEADPGFASPCNRHRTSA